LVLGYADGFYGDSLNSKYKINVYQLAEKPLTSAYYNTKSWKFNNATVLGSKTFTSLTHTRVPVTDIVTGAKDTVRSRGPQVRVPISTTFINNILFGAPSTVLASNTLFQTATKGLYVTLDKNQIGAGGNFMLDLGDSSRVDIYYRTVDGSTIDTALVTLPIATHAAEIKHTYTTAVTTTLANQTTSNSTFYIQAGGGLRTKISFPNLKDLMTKAGGDIVINRAELVITPNAGSTIPFMPQNKISMYRLDIAKQRIPLQDGTSGLSSGVDARALGVDVFGGYYTIYNDYHFIITAYIDDLMRGRSVDYGTFISAVDNTNTQSVDYLPTAETGGRLVAAGSIAGTADPNYAGRIKLNIIYTKVNK
jgi:hypothetical protein